MKVKKSKKRWAWTKKQVRKYQSKDLKFYSCSCSWCTGIDKEIIIKNHYKKHIKEEIDDFYDGTWYEDHNYDDYLNNFFPSWEEEIWHDNYLDDYIQQRDLDTKIPFGILQYKLIWALHKGS